MPITILKTLICVVIFLATMFVAIPVALLYGLVITAVVGVVFVLVFGLAVMIFAGISGGALGGQNMPMDAAILFIFIIASALMIFVVILSVFVFVTGPIWIATKTRNCHKNPISKKRQAIISLSGLVAKELKQNPISQIVEVGGFYVGVIATTFSKTLLIDTRMVDYLTESELKAVIAHEYGHFGEGRSLSYAFLRRCHLSSSFISAQVNDVTGKSIFQKLLKWTTFLIPDFFNIRYILRSIFTHVSSIISSVFGIATKLVIRFYRREFYEAEFAADRKAAVVVDPADVGRALVRLSAMQLLLKLRWGSDAESFAKRWKSMSQRHTITHPSIEYRLKVLGVENADSVLAEVYYLYRDREPELAKVRSDEEDDESISADRSFLMAMSFSQTLSPDDVH